MLVLFILSIRRVAWHGMIWIRCFFFGLVLCVYRRRLCEGAVGGWRWNVAAGAWIPMPTLFSCCSRSFKRERRRSKGNKCLWAKERLGSAGYPGWGWVVASTTHTGEGGLRVCNAIATTNRTEIKVSYLSYRPSSQRGYLLKSDARTGRGRNEGRRGGDIIPIFFIFPIWVIVCAWILGRFGSGFWGLYFRDTIYTWGAGHIYNTYQGRAMPYEKDSLELSMKY